MSKVVLSTYHEGIVYKDDSLTRNFQHDVGVIMFYATFNLKIINITFHIKEKKRKEKKRKEKKRKEKKRKKKKKKSLQSLLLKQKKFWQINK